MSEADDAYESEPYEPDELSVCHHGIGFDEECEDCEIEYEIDEAINREEEKEPQ